MSRRILPLATTALLLLGAGCSSKSADDTGSAASSTTSTAAPETTAGPSSTTTTVPVVEVTSPEVQPAVIDVPGDGVPTGPSVPTDSFAIGDETPRDPKGRPFLSPGDEGDDVVVMQRRLIALGQRVDDSGVYDDATLAAVLSFQKSQGLVTDGIVGTRTWRALDAPKPLTATPTTVPTGDGAAVPAVDPPKNDPASLASSKVTQAVVSLGTQRVTLYAGTKPVATYLISSGRNGLTPVGTFRVQSKSSRTVSNSDNAIGMQWMTRFNGGVGFHGIPVKAGRPLPTPLGQRPVSAGCVRMADNDAKAVYDRVPIGATVVVR